MRKGFASVLVHKEYVPRELGGVSLLPSRGQNVCCKPVGNGAGLKARFDGNAEFAVHYR